MTSDSLCLPQPLRTEITSEYDVGTLWKSMAFPRGDRTSLHLHFLDHDTMGAPNPSTAPQDRSSSSSNSNSISEAGSGASDTVAQHLTKGLSSLSAFTDGIMVSWGGSKREGSNSPTVITDAIFPLFRKGTFTPSDFRTGRSMCVAVPFVTKNQVSSSTGLNLEQAEKVVKGVPAHHVLLPSNAHSSTRVLQYLLNTSVGDGKPAVCVVVGGGKRVLKMVCHALDNNIPVIVMKGTDGIADAIYDLGKKDCDLLKKGQKRPGLRKKDKDRLARVWESWKHLTFYTPSARPLDAVILDALLNGGQFQQAEKYLETVQRRVKDRKESLQKRLPCFIEKKAKMAMFLDSLIRHSPSACAVIVRSLEVPYWSITFGHLLQLYEKSPSQLQISAGQKTRIIGNSILNYFLDTDADDKKAHSGGPGDKSVLRYKKVREDTQGYTGYLMATPLKCPGHKKCKNCQNALNATDKNECSTCLPPVQELFLWSLYFGNPDLTEAFLENVQGKMAACLFAYAVFRGMAKKEKQLEQKRLLTLHARRFEDIATRCLRACYEDDVTKTEELLIQEFNNWDGFSPLQIAIVTNSKAFVAEEGAKNRLDKIWNGTNIGDTGFVDTSTITCRDDVLRLFTPAVAYTLALVFQLLFLLLFSYVLLFDLETSVTPGFIALLVYVVDVAADEFQQLLMDNPVLRTGCTCNLKSKLRAYSSEKWNHLDLLAVVLFGLGMLVFVDNEVAYAFGRVFLCLDALVFFLRFLQMLLYFKNLGIFLVMAKRSMKDTGYFMLILLTVMWGYLVASHGVLFPPPNNATSTWTYVLDLPLKGYWQAFNLDLGDISVCQEVTHRGLEDGECQKESILATRYGHYVASVLLALYLMFINVLLMNLLIAKFNNTFTEVYQKAELHQSWQSCQLVLEYYTHTPAPFSILSFILTSLLSCFGVCCVLCCDDDDDNEDDNDKKKKKEEEEKEEKEEKDEDIELRSRSGTRRQEASASGRREREGGKEEEERASQIREEKRDQSQGAGTSPQNEDTTAQHPHEIEILAVEGEEIVEEKEEGEQHEEAEEEEEEEEEEKEDFVATAYDVFETQHMQKVLRKIQSERGGGEGGASGAVTLASVQSQLDQLRYGLQQVLRRLEAQPLSPASPAHNQV